MKHSVGVAMTLGSALTAGMTVIGGPLATAGNKCVPLDGSNLVQSRTHNPGVGMRVLTTESYSYREGQVLYDFQSTGGLKPRNDRLPGGDLIAPYAVSGSQQAGPGDTITIVTPGYVSTITVCKQ
ncbi:MAG: hypothetical protein WCE30_18070 [Mycobacterium sp.]